MYNPSKLSTTNRVPRPRNAFMIFRSAFWADEKIIPTVEHDHRHISRIIGHCWNQMSEAEKDVWRRKADQEKVEHEMKYPGYRFCPTTRIKKLVKRKVKRNGANEILRCKKVAELLLAGKQGNELADAVNNLKPDEEQVIPDQSNALGSGVRSNLQPSSNIDDLEEPPFRSPLLPPLDLEEEQLNSPALLSPICHSYVYGLASQGDTCIPEMQVPYYEESIPPIPMLAPFAFYSRTVPPLAASLYQLQASEGLWTNDLAANDATFTTHQPSFYLPPSTSMFSTPFLPCDNDSVVVASDTMYVPHFTQRSDMWNEPHNYPFA